MTRDDIIKEAVMQIIEHQSNSDRISQLRREIRVRTDELQELERIQFQDSAYMPKWEQELKQDIDEAYDSYLKSTNQ